MAYESRLTPEQKALIVARWQVTKSINGVAREFNCSPSNVRYHLVKAGVYVKKKDLPRVTRTTVLPPPPVFRKNALPPDRVGLPEKVLCSGCHLNPARPVFEEMSDGSLILRGYQMCPTCCAPKAPSPQAITYFPEAKAIEDVPLPDEEAPQDVGGDTAPPQPPNGLILENDLTDEI